ncbi:MAG: hypothetical protein MPJ24_11405, partial [Pirellulaceae bacterium]|nr:hypothetical protein [Pirellulaceae bacterium]
GPLLCDESLYEPHVGSVEQILQTVFDKAVLNKQPNFLQWKEEEQTMARAIVTFFCLTATLFVTPLRAQDVRQQVETLYGKGVHAYEKANYPEALDLFDEAIALNDKDPRPHYYRGLTNYLSGNEEAASQDFQNGAEREFNLKGDYYNIGETLLKIQGPLRLEITSARNQARQSLQKRKAQQEQIRYQRLKESEKTVLLNADRPKIDLSKHSLTNQIDPSNPFLQKDKTILGAESVIQLKDGDRQVENSLNSRLANLREAIASTDISPEEPEVDPFDTLPEGDQITGFGGGGGQAGDQQSGGGLSGLFANLFGGGQAEPPVVADTAEPASADSITKGRNPRERDDKNFPPNLEETNSKGRGNNGPGGPGGPGTQAKGGSEDMVDPRMNRGRGNGGPGGPGAQTKGGGKDMADPRMNRGRGNGGPGGPGAQTKGGGEDMADPRLNRGRGNGGPGGPETQAKGGSEDMADPRMNRGRGNNGPGGTGGPGAQTKGGGEDMVDPRMNRGRGNNGPGGTGGPGTQAKGGSEDMVDPRMNGRGGEENKSSDNTEKGGNVLGNLFNGFFGSDKNKK